MPLKIDSIAAADQNNRDCTICLLDARFPASSWFQMSMRAAASIECGCTGRYSAQQLSWTTQSTVAQTGLGYTVGSTPPFFSFFGADPNPALKCGELYSIYAIVRTLSPSHHLVLTPSPSFRLHHSVFITLSSLSRSHHLVSIISSHSSAS